MLGAAMAEKGEALLTLFAMAMRDPLLAGAKGALRDKLNEDPLDSLVGTLTVGTLLFYRAEKGKNPKVVTLGDALEFVSTNLSVGYCDIFPRTESGKLIASVIMAIGPALATKALDATAREKAAADAVNLANQREIVDKLEAILQELRASRPV